MMNLPHRPEGRQSRPHASAAQEKAAEPCSLDRAPRNCKLEVVEVEGGASASRQLAHLGISVGAFLQVKRSAPMGGPVLVEIRGSTVAIGKGVARKVLVRIAR